MGRLGSCAGDSGESEDERCGICIGFTGKPGHTLDGEIIILNLPVKEYNELGQFAHVLFKFIWQRAVERRIPPLIDPKKAEQTSRPVLLWADESQFFVNSYDAPSKAQPARPVPAQCI